MRPRNWVEDDMRSNGMTGPTIPNWDWLVMEMLLDIRELLQRLQPPTIITATEEETNGRD